MATSLALNTTLNPETLEVMDQMRQQKVIDNKDVQPKIELTPTMMLDFLNTIVVKLAQMLLDWNNKKSSKLELFIIYNFEIRGVTRKSAQKRLRRFQAECGIVPGTTKPDLNTERIRLINLIDKTTRSAEEE